MRTLIVIALLLTLSIVPTYAQDKAECPPVELSGQLLTHEQAGTRLYCDFGGRYELKKLCPTIANRVIVKARMQAKSLRCVYLSTWENTP